MNLETMESTVKAMELVKQRFDQAESIKELWAVYSLVIPFGASEEQVKQTKRAFYGGVDSFISMIIRMADRSSSDATAADMEFMAKIQGELGSFVSEMRAGRA